MIKYGPELLLERFLNHGWDDEEQLKVLVKWFRLPEKEATWQFNFSLSKEAIRKLCGGKHVQPPALTRDGVFFSEQVKGRAFGMHVTNFHPNRKENQKLG